MQGVCKDKSDVNQELSCMFNHMLIDSDLNSNQTTEDPSLDKTCSIDSSSCFDLLSFNNETRSKESGSLGAYAPNFNMSKGLLL